MSSAIVTMSLTLAVHAFGLGHADFGSHHDPYQGSYILPDGPGDGWGFPNGQPDNYGWMDHGTYLPLGANRTPEYYFPRYFAVPRADVSADVLQLLRDAWAAVHPVRGWRRGSPDGRTAALVVAPACVTLHRKPR